ncbi:Dedicator of cytokinesis protein [Trichinella pseudospiralis]
MFCKEFCRSVSGKHEEYGSCISSPNCLMFESTNDVAVSSLEKTSPLFFSQMNSQKSNENNNTEIGYTSVLSDFSCDDSSLYLKNGNFCMPKCLKSPSPDQLPMPPTQWVSAN